MSDALLKACAREGSCEGPLAGRHNGTFSLTSMGGVATTFLLEWFKRLEKTRSKTFSCRHGGSTEQCRCAALALPLHLVSCKINDDGIFKHLVDPRALNDLPNHKAIYVVGDPIAALHSIFRRRFQCWHMYRLHNCWFEREQREGLIPCAQPGIRSFRRRFGDAASECRVPRSGPLSSVAAYAQQGEDLFGAAAQFRRWLSCRRPLCRFDILVVRYETLNQSIGAIFDFLELPPAVRATFPGVRVQRHTHTEQMDPVDRQQLEQTYRRLDEATRSIPPDGLLLRNT